MELTPLDNKEGDESDIKRKHWFTIQDDALEAFREIVGLSESTGGKKSLCFSSRASMMPHLLEASQTGHAHTPMRYISMKVLKG